MATADGVHAMVPREKMDLGARKLRDAYAMVPGAPLYKKEFGYYCLDRWFKEGLAPDADFAKEFDYDPPGLTGFGGLGWCEPGYLPNFEEKTVEQLDEYDIVRDWAGRTVKFFKGRRNGFMPEYMDFPVHDRKDWEELCKPRLDPTTSARYEGLGDHMQRITPCIERGWMVNQSIAGAGMYLRAMFGVQNMMLAFYDMPDVVHDMMATWLKLADAVTAAHQKLATFDQLFIAEDICYNHGPLVGPDIFKEFWWPYYQQLITNIKSRQIDQTRHMYIQIDTDGDCRPTIPWYMEEIGMDVMSPFEVASGCDVVEQSRQYPNLVMTGGIDKRVIALGPPAIDKYLERVIPPMRERGGYIPTSDHGVPEECSLENYRYYRKRIVELGGN
ncbi:MAG: uroporphyrinogen decarboxylase family protein [Planctomycetaceae bacterium]|nr:hypothetical protein [Planctomycetaceae bacterium]